MPICMMDKNNGYYIGLMSGTSVDAVDAVVARFADGGVPSLVATHSVPPPAKLRTALLNAAQPGHRLTLADYGALDQATGAWLAQAANEVMAKAGLHKQQICAIGSHGQTLWHAPEANRPFTLQIGSAPHIAAATGCPVIADFRNADMAIGGQGAPLVCAFHAALFAHPEAERVAVNIGGIANITLLPRQAATDNTTIRGFDTGPGNGLMDAWINRHLGLDLDAGGRWAASGYIDQTLLQQLLQDDYFHQAPPKSTGREHFSLAWLDEHLQRLSYKPAAVDVQATLCELTALTITAALADFGFAEQAIYLCGGGVHNDHLVARIRAHTGTDPVQSTAALDLDPDWIEALAFAWLARQRVLNRPGNAPGVTGAQGPAILGGWHEPPAATA